jgi:drug/metabolite transporter (DMT)-like permease
MPTRAIDLALLGVAAVWGSSYLAIKEIATSDMVFAVLALRFALAAAVLAGVLSRRLRAITPAELLSGAVGGLILGAVCVCETYGVTRTSASNAGMIMAVTIIVTPLLAHGGAATAVPPRFYIAGAAAVLGCGLLTQSGGLAVPGIGDTVVAVAALLRAVHVTTMARLSGCREIDPARTTLVQLVTVAAVSSALAEFCGQSVMGLATGMGRSDWLLIGYLAVACTVVAFLVQLRSLCAASPARVSLLLGTEPLWAALVGIVIAGDAVTLTGAAGAALVMMGTGWGRVLLTSACRIDARATA